jgi:hypothetical protein
MRSFLFFIVTLLLNASCTNEAKKESSIPNGPATMIVALKELKNKNYVVEDVGFIRIFMDKEDPIKWTKEMPDTSKMYKDFVNDRKNFSLSFITDTTVKIVDEKTDLQALWSLEKDTSNTILLHLKYEDASFNMPGATEPTMVTYTYKIKGIDDKNMLLETPRQYNDMPVALLMKKKE